MAIHYTISFEEGVLKVCASGSDENLADVQQYGMAILTAAKEHGATRVLCDERDLVYRLNTFDTFTAAASIAENAVGVGKVALVCNPANMGDAHFFENVVVNRGLSLLAFTDMASALHWLGIVGE
jgi:hypothetical protein